MLHVSKFFRQSKIGKFCGLFIHVMKVVVRPPQIKNYLRDNPKKKAKNPAASEIIRFANPIFNCLFLILRYISTINVDQVVRAPQNPSRRNSDWLIAPSAIKPIKKEPKRLAMKIPKGNLYFGRNMLSSQNRSGEPSAAPIENRRIFIAALQKSYEQLGLPLQSQSS